MVISVADDDHLYQQVRTNQLPTNWRSIAAYPELQRIGAEWYHAKASLVLKVPSAIISFEYDYLLNLAHPELRKKVKLVRVEDYFWDARLQNR